MDMKQLLYKIRKNNCELIFRPGEDDIEIAFQTRVHDKLYEYGYHLTYYTFDITEDLVEIINTVFDHAIEELRDMSFEDVEVKPDGRKET